MNRGLMITFGVLGAIVVILLMIFMSVVSTYNSAVSLKVAIEAKQKDNKSEFDNLKKKISQVAQVTTAQMESLENIFNGYAKARTGEGNNDKLIMKWITESIPNVDTSTFKNLQNIIVSCRDAWTMRQKELIDMNREYSKSLQTFPSNIVLSMLGFKPIEIVIITSTSTENTFVTGKDDDNDVFGKKVEK
jgi:hypothetical protein